MYDINKDGYINKEVSELRVGGMRWIYRRSEEVYIVMFFIYLDTGI